MEQNRKQLRISSLIVLLFAAVTLVQIISEVLFGDLESAVIPEGAPENILLITQIVLLVISLVLLLPQIYVGLKGLKVAKTPNSSKGHIVWAIILLAISILNMITPVVDIVKGGNAFDNLSSFFSYLLEATIFFEYIRYARAVAKGN